MTQIVLLFFWRRVCLFVCIGSSIGEWSSEMSLPTTSLCSFSVCLKSEVSCYCDNCKLTTELSTSLSIRFNQCLIRIQQYARPISLQKKGEKKKLRRKKKKFNNPSHRYSYNNIKWFYLKQMVGI